MLVENGLDMKVKAMQLSFPQKAPTTQSKNHLLVA